MPPCGFQSALLTAKQLKQFVYVPENSITTPEEVLPLEWLLDAVFQQEISTDLDVIQVGLDNVFFRREIEDTDMDEFLEIVRGSSFEQEEFDKMVLPVNPFWSNPKKEFIIDLKAIANLSAK